MKYKQNGNNKKYSAEWDAKQIPPFMQNLPFILGSIGTLWGIYYAFKHNGGWSYIGYSILGSVAGSIAGGIVTAVTYPSYLSAKTKI